MKDMNKIIELDSTKSDYLSDVHPSLSLRLIAPLEWFGLWTINTSDITVGRLITPCRRLVLIFMLGIFV
jgi:hypothetical protein